MIKHINLAIVLLSSFKQDSTNGVISRYILEFSRIKRTNAKRVIN